ncbi:MAG: undecaprenyl-diphosphate phosphatase [Gemmatimonadota bacterium]
MLFAPIIIAIILGLVEGATEFLPVSSTGHLIVVGGLLNFTGQRAATFEIVIQLGAILAVIWHYRATLWHLVTRLVGDPAERRLAGNLVLAFLPAAIIGLLAHDWIKANLFSPTTVAAALIVGGVIMLVLEWFRPAVTTGTIRDITPRQALGIGFAQVLSMVPGTSRAAATILGGYGLGLSRPAATEFSFLLAIPTIVGAAGLDLVKSRDLLTMADLPMFAVGTLVAFVAALGVIRGFLRFIERHSFVAFAWYRIAFGGLLALLFAMRAM